MEFRKFSEFNRGIMLAMLRNAYSFEPGYEKDWLEEWKKADDFIYDNLHIADKYGFITVVDGVPVGFICWDPRNLPAYVEIGHNCIITQYKGNGYGRAQLREAAVRIEKSGAEKIIVTTDERLIPARRNYERAGFRLIGLRENKHNPQYAGQLMDYERIPEK